MKLINNVIIEPKKPQVDESLVQSIEFIDAMNDSDYEDQHISVLCDDILNIINLKQHIGKFGMSEEVISLYSENLKVLNLLDSDKEMALETLEDILEHNGITGTTISEELISTIIMAMGSVSKTLERLTLKFMTKSFGTVRILKDFEKKIKTKNPIMYLTSRTLRIPDYKEYKRKLDKMVSISSKLRSINPDSIIQDGDLDLLLEFKDLGYDFTTDGKLVVKPKDIKERRTLLAAHWTESDIKSALSTCITFEKYLNNYKYVSKKLRESHDKLKNSSKEEKIDRAEVKAYRRNLKTYRLVAKLCMIETNKLLFTMVSICKSVIKKI